MAQTIDSKKAEFRKYLDSNGVVDALTKVLVGLYEEPEKPANALEFVLQNLTAKAAGTSDVEALKKENATLKARVEELEAQLAAAAAAQPASSS